MGWLSGSKLTVEEEDGSPSIGGVTKIQISNATLTDDGGGQVSIAVTPGVLSSIEGVSPTSEVAPGTLLAEGGDAWPGATVNTTGANLILAGGIGRRIYTVVAYGHASMADSTATVTVNGAATVLTEGVEWTAATSNKATATSPAAAIDAVSGVSATASSAVVRMAPDVGAYSLTIAKSAADAGMTATSGTNGVVSVIGPESLELEHLKFLDGAGHFSGFKAQAQAADLTYTLPAAHGTGYLYDDGAGALAWSTPAGGANTALSNLASVAINAALTTGAGAAAALTASPPAQTASAQAGIAAGVTASDAVAGDTNVGAAAGGSVTVTAGDAARLTSGDANGGDIELVTGAGIGTGTNGVVKIPYVGGVFSPIQFGSTAANRLYLNNESQNILIWGGSGGVSVDAMNSNSYKTAAGWELWGYGGPFSVGKDFQFVWGPGTIYGSPDVGIVRGGAPGILKISDSSTGYGALSLDTNARVYADTVSLSDAAKTAVLDIAIADGEYIGGAPPPPPPPPAAPGNAVPVPAHSELGQCRDEEVR